MKYTSIPKGTSQKGLFQQFTSPKFARCPSHYRSRLSLSGLGLSGLGFFGLIPSVEALPQGGQVTAGSIQFQQSPGQLHINQSSTKGIINWDQFSIGASERVYFQQPSLDSATLNRVTGSFSSEIAGRLDAVGTVLLINPNGIVFTPTAQVDVGSILATTLDLKDSDFMAGFYQLQQQSNQPLKTVENYGSIRVKDRGFAAFVAPGVENHGVIQARLGTVAIGSGTSATLDLFGDELLSVAVDPSLGDRIYDSQGQLISSLIDQTGTITADGGRVILSAETGANLFSQVINLEGVVRARSLQTDQGQVVLSGGETGQVAINGILDASALDADADAGTLEVSGADIQVSETAQLLANADQVGEGGEISVIGTNTAQIDGDLIARGGDRGGNGGQVETSAKAGLGVSESAQVDVGAPQGDGGTWRLDPDRLFVDDTSVGSGLPGSATGDHSVAASVIEDALNVGNVELEANELIQVDAPIDTSSQINDNTLNFKDQNNDTNLTINLNAVVEVSPSQTLTGEGTVVNVNTTTANSVQAGVDVAASGATVNLGAGSFTGTQDSVVTINKDLTFQGQGTGTTIIDGQMQRRGVSVTSGTVTIQNLRVANGLVQGSLGELAIGGGVSIENGATVSINQSLIQNNQASLGGGIANDGTLTLVNSNVTGNRAVEVGYYTTIYGVTGGVGGGVLNGSDGTLEVSSSTISNNTAELAGGGVGNLGTATIQSSLISGNVARDENTLPSDYDFTFGGGIGNVGTLTVLDSRIENNSAVTGGGIVNTTKLDVDPRVVNPNFTGTVDISNSQIVRNNQFKPNASFDTIGDNYFSYSEPSGGGIANIDGVLNIENSTVSENEAEGEGGGVSVSGGTITLNNSIVSENTSKDEGGGLYFREEFSEEPIIASISNSEINGNIAEEDGGGIHVNVEEGSISIVNTTISDKNTSGESGGGIYIEGDNDDDDDDGDDDDVTIVNSTISDNISREYGGGIYITEATVSIINSTISENLTSFQGGGLYIGNSTVSIVNSTISGNDITSNRSYNGGGGIHIEDGGIVSITNSTITDNTSSGQGGGIYLEANEEDTIVTIGNSIVSGNSAPTGAEVYIEDIDNDQNDFVSNGFNIVGQNGDSGGFPTIATDIIPSGSTATVLDPILRDNGGPTLTHALINGSPAIDAGGNTQVLTDQRGIPRPQNQIPDIGAFEVERFLLSIGAGNSQTASINTGFQEFLIVTVTDSLGNVVSDGTVTFTAPGTGASILEGTTITVDINSNGEALLPVTANAIAGDYQITVTTAGGLNTVSFNLRNLQNTTPPPSVVTRPPTSEQQRIDQNTRLKSSSPNSTPPPGSRIVPPNPLSFPQPIVSANANIAQIENAFTRTLNQYFGTTSPQILSPKLVEQTLRIIDQIPEVTPALVYAYFADASSPTATNTPQSTLVASTDFLQLSQTPLISETSNTISVAPQCLSQQNSNPTDPLWQFDDCGWKDLYPNLKQQQDNDQLVIVLVTSDGQTIRKRLPDATRAKLGETVKQFQRSVSGSLSAPSRKKQLGQELYQMLIEPIKSDLESRSVNNLVFVMDEGLRAIPMAALHDGNDYIVNQYSVGFMPSMSLADTSYESIQDADLIAMGAQTFDEQSALPSVPLELSSIQQLWQGETYLDEAFTPEQLKQARQNASAKIVHLATHGEFIPGKRDRSYIQFWGGTKVGLDELEQLKLNQDPPVSLLVLSACRTAMGDPSAELGFTGLAVASGVKTAMGGLWNISDLGTYALMVSFYEQLKTAPIKAEALRRAQLSLLQKTVYFQDGHLITPQQRIALPKSFVGANEIDLTDPYYWSGITMIGSPW